MVVAAGHGQTCSLANKSTNIAASCSHSGFICTSYNSRVGGDTGNAAYIIGASHFTVHHSVFHECTGSQLCKQRLIVAITANRQRHGVAVAVKGAGKVAGIGLGDNDILRQRIAAAGVHRRKLLRGADSSFRQRQRRAAAAGKPGHRHFLSRLLLLLRLLILGGDIAVRIRRGGLFLLGLLLLIRGQRVGQHGGGQQADDHHDGQQPAYDSLLHISFSFM